MLSGNQDLIKLTWWSYHQTIKTPVEIQGFLSIMEMQIHQLMNDPSTEASLSITGLEFCIGVELTAVLLFPLLITVLEEFNDGISSTKTSAETQLETSQESALQ